MTKFKVGDLITASKEIRFYADPATTVVLMVIPSGTFGVVKLATDGDRVPVKFVGFHQCRVLVDEIEQAGPLDMLAWNVSEMDEQGINTKGAKYD